MATLLSVNVNKVAVLRNSRGGKEPNVLDAVAVCLRAGCQGITVHPRPDQRHIRPDDVRAIAAMLPAGIEFNIEGNPFAPARGGYPGLLALVRETRPAQVTFVPDGDSQLTSDHGFDLRAPDPRLPDLIKSCKASGARVSLFVDHDVEDLHAARKLGADRIEIYTGPFADAFARGDADAAGRCARLAQRATELGLGVNAGHDLNQQNLRALITAAPQIREVSIGHALISEALHDGLFTTVRRYLAILAA